MKKTLFWSLSIPALALSIWLVGPIAALGADLYNTEEAVRVIASYFVFFLAPIPPYVVVVIALLLYDSWVVPAAVRDDSYDAEWYSGDELESCQQCGKLRFGAECER